MSKVTLIYLTVGKCYGSEENRQEVGASTIAVLRSLTTNESHFIKEIKSAALTLEQIYTI